MIIPIGRFGLGNSLWLATARREAFMGPFKNVAEKKIALHAVSLIIAGYLPSICGKRVGGSAHSLKTWEKIMAAVEATNVPNK
jgi:hypothetical protein